MYRQISQTALWGLLPACGRQVHGLVLSDKVKGTTCVVFRVESYGGSKEAEREEIEPL